VIVLGILQPPGHAGAPQMYANGDHHGQEQRSGDDKQYLKCRFHNNQRNRTMPVLRG